MTQKKLYLLTFKETNRDARKDLIQETKRHLAPMSKPLTSLGFDDNKDKEQVLIVADDMIYTNPFIKFKDGDKEKRAESRIIESCFLVQYIYLKENNNANS